MRFCLAKQPNINVSCIKREVLLEEIIAGLSGCRIPCRGMTYHKKTPIKGGVNVHMHEGCALKIFYRQNEDLIPYTVLNQSITAETVLEKPVSIDLTVSVLDMQDIFNQIINQ